MHTGLEGKHIVITASTNGIGYAAAKMFIEEGAYVVINGRNKDVLKERCRLLEKEYGDGCVLGFCGDVTKQSDIVVLKKYVNEKMGKIDCLVANAGSGRPIAESRLEINEWKAGFDINLFSAVKLIHEFEDSWNSGEKGNIVLLSSLAACDRIGAPYAYAAAKEGIRVLTKYLSDDYAFRNIRVNCVMPGNVLFPGGRWEELLENNREETERYIRENVPLKRFAKPEEIASAIVFLASELASFITGTSLVVDGGQKRGIA